MAAGGRVHEACCSQRVSVSPPLLCSSRGDLSEDNMETENAAAAAAAAFTASSQLKEAVLGRAPPGGSTRLAQGDQAPGSSGRA